MVVYKAYFRIVKRNLPQLLIYFAIFLFLAISLAQTMAPAGDMIFTKTRVPLALINEDGDSPLTTGLLEYLEKNARFVEIPNDTQKLQDALFFQEVEYILRIPAGFHEALLQGEVLQLERIAAPLSTGGVYLDNLVNKYFNTVKTYLGALEDLSETELLAFVKEDLNQEATVALNSGQTSTDVVNNSRRAYYFNYLSYALFSVMILGICTVMMVFNDTNLKNRNHCTPVKPSYFNFQMVLGTLSYAVFAWFIMIGASFFLYGSFMFTTKGLLFLLNSFLFSLAALSISYLLGNLVRSKNAMSAVANVFSLGTSFISGVFVPQQFLGDMVLKISSFTPTYWYVRSNLLISGLNQATTEALRPIFFNMLIIIGFAVAVLSVALVIGKQRKMS